MMAICNNHSTLTALTLKCKVCGAKFHTKNIDYIGARSIFPNQDDPLAEKCDHNVGELVHECKGFDAESFRSELELFEAQGRSKEEVEDIFMNDYGFGTERIRRELAAGQ